MAVWPVSHSNTFGKCEGYVNELQKDNAVDVFGKCGKHSVVARPGSYINALSFGSPKHLADHLTSVAEDSNLYKSYFNWKGKYDLYLYQELSPTYINPSKDLHGEDMTKKGLHYDGGGRKVADRLARVISSF
ncbi:hypothetical protein IscW_ISCW023329 [Ixodes scapularis]|uniref:Fucosyltransferase n=1 Tax=Ixodes scapularis TaxID=6945 RepID=B7QH12_IXOSC|nr:hypothetical protein IscW_ISCW023329 [Ixodes scapularis]|eukprot:XP_002414469.1 hypothetical protein IscW_ISCW023329 [Ixodes scapularis]